MSTRVTEAGEFFGTSAPDDGLVEAEIAAFDRFRRQFLGTGLSCIQASDMTLVRRAPKMWILLSSRRTSPFVFLLFLIGHKAFHVDTAAARSSACVR